MTPTPTRSTIRIMEWLKNNPGGNMADCAGAIGVAAPTVRLQNKLHRLGFVRQKPGRKVGSSIASNTSSGENDYCDAIEAFRECCRRNEKDFRTEMTRLMRAQVDGFENGIDFGL